MTEYEVQVIDLLTQQLQSQQDIYLLGQELLDGVLQIPEHLISLVFILGVIIAMLLVIIFALTWGCD